VLRQDGKVDRPRLGSADPLRAYVAEIKEVARCIHSGRPSEILGGRLARDAVLMCHKQTESARSGRIVRI
jgi:predicted dehydrogenase